MNTTNIKYILNQTKLRLTKYIFYKLNRFILTTLLFIAPHSLNAYINDEFFDDYKYLKSSEKNNELFQYIFYNDYPMVTYISDDIYVTLIYKSNFENCKKASYFDDSFTDLPSIRENNYLYESNEHLSINNELANYYIRDSYRTRKLINGLSDESIVNFWEINCKVKPDVRKAKLPKVDQFNIGKRINTKRLSSFTKLPGLFSSYFTYRKQIDEGFFKDGKVDVTLNKYDRLFQITKTSKSFSSKKILDKNFKLILDGIRIKYGEDFKYLEKSGGLFISRNIPYPKFLILVERTRDYKIKLSYVDLEVKSLVYKYILGEEKRLQRIEEMKKIYELKLEKRKLEAKKKEAEILRKKKEKEKEAAEKKLLKEKYKHILDDI